MESQLEQPAQLNIGKFPDFIIAGIEKSGTTSLFVNLSRNPSIEMTPNAQRYMQQGLLNNIKEPQFFNKRWSKGIAWYRGLFNDNDKLQGEAASNYLFSEDIIKRMAATVPDAKIIVSLRNPVTRAYSQYYYGKELYRDSLNKRLALLLSNKDQFLKVAKLKNQDFDEAIRIEIAHGVVAGTGNIGKGLYIDLIENLLKYYRRQQVMFIICEQMRQDMQGAYNKIFDFLGVNRAPINFDMNVLVGKYDKPMSHWARATLEEYFKPANEHLFGFLGYRIAEWGAL